MVSHPKECLNCDKLACEQCLEEWAAKDLKCAFCRENYNTKNPNRKLIGQLNEKEFECEKCLDLLKYVDYEAHAKKCFVSF